MFELSFHLDTDSAQLLEHIVRTDSNEELGLTTLNSHLELWQLSILEVELGWSCGVLKNQWFLSCCCCSRNHFCFLLFHLIKLSLVLLQQLSLNSANIISLLKLIILIHL